MLRTWSAKQREHGGVREVYEVEVREVEHEGARENGPRLSREVSGFNSINIF